MPKRYFKNTFADGDENVLNTPTDYWRDKVKDLVERVDRNVSSTSKNPLYTGTAGVAFMFYRLATSEKFVDGSTTFLEKAAEVLKQKENHNGPKKSSQFICGDAGVNATNAAIHHRLDDAETAKMYLDCFESGLIECKRTGSMRPGDNELFVGRAGYLFGVLWLEKVFGTKILPDQDIIELCSAIVEFGRCYSKKNKSSFPLMYSHHNKEYLGLFSEINVNFKQNSVISSFLNTFIGAAHGLCTILQVLISFPQFIEKESQARQDIKKCIDKFVSLQTSNGNFPTRILEPGEKQRLEEDELVHWCHGAPGK